MIWLILIISTLLVMGSGALLTNYTEGDFTPMVVVGAFGIFVITTTLFIGTFVASQKHAEDIESIEYHEHRIEIQEERLNRLRETLQSFEYPKGALMNKDSPVASIVTQISDTERSIAEAKTDVERTKRNIRARKRWMFSYVTWIIGD